MRMKLNRIAVKDKKKFGLLVAYKHGSIMEYCDKIGVSYQYYHKTLSSPITEAAYKRLVAPMNLSEEEASAFFGEAE